MALAAEAYVMSTAQLVVVALFAATLLLAVPHRFRRAAATLSAAKAAASAAALACALAAAESREAALLESQRAAMERRIGALTNDNNELVCASEVAVRALDDRTMELVQVQPNVERLEAALAEMKARASRRTDAALMTAEVEHRAEMQEHADAYEERQSALAARLRVEIEMTASSRAALERSEQAHTLASEAAQLQLEAAQLQLVRAAKEHNAALVAAAARESALQSTQDELLRDGEIASAAHRGTRDELSRVHATHASVLQAADAATSEALEEAWATAGDLQIAHDEKLCAFRAAMSVEVQILEAARMDTVANADAQLGALRDAHTHAMANQLVLHEDAQSVLERSHANALVSLEAVEAEKLRAFRAAMSEEMQILEAARMDAVANAEAQLGALRDAQTHALANQLVMHEDAQSVLERSHANALVSLEAVLAEQHDAAETEQHALEHEFFAVSDAMRSTHADALRSQRAEWDAKRRAQGKAHEATLAVAKAQIAAVRTRHEAAQRSLVAAHAVALDAAVAELAVYRASHARDLRKLRSVAEAELHAAKSQLSAEAGVVRTLEEASALALVAAALQLEKASGAHAAELAQEHALALSARHALGDTLRAEAEALTTVHWDELDAAKAALDNVRGEHARELAAVHAAMVEASGAHEAQQRVAEHDADALRRESTVELQRICAAHAIELRMLRASAESKEINLALRIRKGESKYDAESAAHAAAAEDLLATRSACADELLQATARLEELQAAEAALRLAHDAERDAMESSIAQRGATMRAQNRTVKAAHLSAVASAAAKLSDARADAATMRAAHTVALEEAAGQLASFRRAHADEVDALRGEFVGEMHVLETNLRATAEEKERSARHCLQSEAMGELEVVRREHASQVKTHADAATAAVESGRQARRGAMRDAAAKLKAFRKVHAIELQKHRGAATAKEAVLTAELEQTRSDLMSAHGAHAVEMQRHRNAADVTEEKLMKILRETEEELRGVHAAHTAALEKQQTSSRSVEAGLTACLRTATLELGQVRDDHAEGLKTLRVAAAAELDQHRDSHAAALKTHRNAADEKFRRAEEELVRFRVAEEQSTQQLKMRDAELNKQRQGSAEQIEARLGASLEAELAQARAQHAAALAEQESKHRAATDELVRTSNAAKQTEAMLGASLQAELAQARERHECELEEKESSLTAAMFQSECANAAEMECVEAAHSAAELACSTSIESKLAWQEKAMRETHMKALDDAAAELEALRSTHKLALEDHQSAAEEAQRALEGNSASALRTALTEMQSFRAQYARELALHRGSAEEREALLVLSEKTLEEKLRVAKELHVAHGGALEAAQVELASFHALHSHEIDALRDSAVQEMQALKARLQAISDLREEEAHREHRHLRDEARAAKEEHSAFRGSVESSEAVRAAHASTFEHALAEAKRSKSRELAELEARLLGETADMVTSHFKALNEAAEELDLIQKEHALELVTLRETATMQFAATQDESALLGRLHAEVEKRRSMEAENELLAAELSTLKEALRAHDICAVGEMRQKT